MAFNTMCPECWVIFSAPDEAAGRRVRCPKCKASFIIPPDAGRHAELPTTPPVVIDAPKPAPLPVPKAPPQRPPDPAPPPAVSRRRAEVGFSVCASCGQDARQPVSCGDCDAVVCCEDCLERHAKRLHTRPVLRESDPDAVPESLWRGTPQVTSNVHVEVSAGREGAALGDDMGLGLASLALGFLCVPLMFCMPPAAIALGALGTLLGVVGVFLAMNHKGRGIGLSIAGAAVSFCFGGFALLFAVFIGGTLLSALAAIDQESQRSRPEPVRVTRPSR